MVQVAAGASEPPQENPGEVEKLKGGFAVKGKDIPEIVSGAVPVFVSVTAIGVAEVLTVVFGKATEDGLKLTPGAVGPDVESVR